MEGAPRVFSLSPPTLPNYAILKLPLQARRASLTVTLSDALDARFPPTNGGTSHILTTVALQAVAQAAAANRPGDAKQPARHACPPPPDGLLGRRGTATRSHWRMGRSTARLLQAFAVPSSREHLSILCVVCE